MVWLASWMVPRGRRDEWREEWNAELSALSRARGAAEAEAGQPGRTAFALGAFPAAAWTATEGWTIDGVLLDFRYSIRTLLRAPGFTLAAATTLALGIGANASVFSLVNGLVLRSPAGVEAPDRLVQVARSYEQDPRWDNFSWPAMTLIADESPTFDRVAAYWGGVFVLGRGAEIEQVPGEYVSGDYFGTLGVAPALGRLLQPADDLEPHGHPVVVLAHGLWTRRFGADPRVVGSTLLIGSEPYQVVGVAPLHFAGVSALGTAPQLWIPTMQVPGRSGALPFDNWGWSMFQVIARMRDGTSIEEARASMDVVSVRLREAASVNEGMQVLLAPGVGMEPAERAEVKRISFLLVLIVGIVLLLTCANVANLFLSQALARRGEVGVRVALGASRMRVARQVMSETVIVGIIAALLATPAVLASYRILPWVLPYTISVSLRPDGWVLAFLAAIGVVAGLLFGLVPAWVSSRQEGTIVLGDSKNTNTKGVNGIRDALVVAQLALSLGLVAGAGLLSQSVSNARSAEVGFSPEGLIGGAVQLDATGRYDSAQGLDLYQRLMNAASDIPNVASVTMANQVPIAGGHSRATVSPLHRSDLAFEAEYIIVAGDYFETLGVPVLRGRPLGGIADEPHPVVVVNQALASMFWPGTDPLGKHLSGDPPLEVVGVVGDVKMRSLRSQPRPAVYYPVSQTYSAYMVLHARAGTGQRLPPSVLQDVAATVDPQLPMARVFDFRTVLSESLAETQTIGLLVSIFAGLALTLAAVGLYGLFAHSASQRAQEIAIRIALGARPSSLARVILRRGLALSAVGITLGLAVAAAFGGLLEQLLFGVGSFDVAVISAAALSLLATTAVAAWLPARKASRVDPALSLRR